MMPPDNSFKRQLKTGFIYTAIAKYSGIVISLGVTAILSRILTPEDFGVIAVATVFIVFFGIFSDMGLGAAIIQKRDLSTSDLRSLFSYTFFLGLFLGFLFFVFSGLIGRWYNDSQLVPICQILSVNVVFSTWNIVPNGLLFRDKQFKFIGIRSIIIQVTLALISIIAAYTGLGVYALLINPVGGSILLFILSYLKKPTGLTIHPDFSSVKKIASYSGFTFGFSLINYFTRNLDKLLIGRVIGLSALGYYEKSYRLMLLPIQNLTHVITPVLHPVLADFQDNLKIQTDKYLKLLRILALLGFPISAFLYFSAKPLILIIFGDQWFPSIPVFQILSLTVGLQITGSTLGAFLQATNKTKQMFYLGIVNTIISIIGLLIGIYIIRSIEGVAWMWVLTGYIGLWNICYFARIVRIPLGTAFQPYVISLTPTIFVIVLLLASNSFFKYSLMGTLIINSFICVGVILFFLKYYKIFNVLHYFKKRFKK